MEQKLNKLLILIIFALILLKIYLLKTTYFNIDIFIYSYIAEHISNFSYIHSVQFFPPLNYFIQSAFQFLLRPNNINSLIIIWNLVWFLFSIWSLTLLFMFLNNKIKIKKNSVYLLFIYVITIPYLFFNSITWDTSNIYAFFITLLGYIYFSYDYKDKYFDTLIMLSLFWLLISRKESFILISIFLFFNLFFWKSLKNWFFLIVKFFLFVFVPFVILFKLFTWAYFYIEVLDIFKWILWYSVLSSNSYHALLLNNLILNPNITWYIAWVLNWLQQSKNIILTICSTITFFTFIFWIWWFLIYWFKKSSKFLFPIFSIIWILFVFFVLSIKNFQWALYNIDIFFQMEWVESFQRYFIPYVYLFAMWIWLYFTKNYKAHIYIVLIFIFINILNLSGEYSNKWKYWNFDNYINPIETYGWLWIWTNYLNPWNVELSKFIRSNSIDWDILYLSYRNQSAQVIDMAFLSKNKNIITFYNSWDLLPWNNATLTKLPESWLYKVVDNYKEIQYISDDYTILYNYDYDKIKKLWIKYIELDTNFINLKYYFSNSDIPKLLFKYDNIYFFKID